MTCLNQHRALLLVNGQAPNHLPTDIANYRYIACTDGAYHRYVASSHITPHFIIGDLDSLQTNVKRYHVQTADIPGTIAIIHTPDQNQTDFEKALLFLDEKGVNQFTIYGASGRASDHFLGNLSVAMRYHQRYQLDFYDDYGHFFFAKPNQRLQKVQGKIISLIPLSEVTALSLTGFEYPLINQTLRFGEQISLRNKAISDDVTIRFADGDLLVFIESDKP